MGTSLHEVIDDDALEDGEETPEAPSSDFGEIMDEGFSSPEIPASSLEFAGPSSTPRRSRSALGPNASPELKELFTEGGIGKVFTNGLNSLFRACGADELDDTDEKTTRKIVAYYFQARMPKASTKYQPEVLLLSQLAMIFATRVQPIANKTAPFWRRVFDRFRRKE